ncbi:MAG: hypothetical protein IID58_04750 [Proteobacteria bacterium]|nr:hypothetical protein [Pseudomonadota bacterium]
MKFTLESSTAVTIRSVSDQEIRIGDQSWTHTIALTNDGILDGWIHRPMEALVESDLALLLETGPELIVLGTGNKYILPPRDLVFALARRGVGLEVMDTPAAARTFNVLISENRRVAALLYL